MRLLLGSEEHTSELQSPCNLVCGFCFDRKSTRLNSGHLVISYAVFCLKKKNTVRNREGRDDEHVLRPAETRLTQDGGRQKSQCIAFFFFFFNDRAPPEIYPLSLHDPLPILERCLRLLPASAPAQPRGPELFAQPGDRSEEHTSELQSPCNLVCRLLLEK